MKVHGPTRPHLELVRPVTGSKSSERSAPVTGERVEVSEQAQLLREARQPEVTDDVRVERLREAIAKGAFKVDPERIANLMLSEER